MAGIGKGEEPLVEEERGGREGTGHVEDGKGGRARGEGAGRDEDRKDGRARGRGAGRDEDRKDGRARGRGAGRDEDRKDGRARGRGAGRAEDRKSGRAGNRAWLLTAAGMAVAALLLQAAARGIAGFGEWYAVTAYPVLVNLLARITSLCPWSFTELGACALILLCVYYLIRHFREPARLLTRALFVAAAMFLVFTCNCGINYYRYPFSRYSGLEVRNSTKEELYDLCLYLTIKANELCQVDDGAASLSDLQEQGVRAMNHLGTVYPQLGGFYPRPKPLLFSYTLSVQQLCGFYSPFTIEANFNRDMPDYNKPHTICHELSHLKGFMREDEANFIGYLACIQSEDDIFRYSGYLSGWIYATNALAKVDMEAYISLYRQLDPRAAADLEENDAFWERYEGKVAEVSNTLNDTYLKMNDQTDGVKSYGRVVDLMLAYRRADR